MWQTHMKFATDILKLCSLCYAPFLAFVVLIALIHTK